MHMALPLHLLALGTSVAHALSFPSFRLRGEVAPLGSLSAEVEAHHDYATAGVLPAMPRRRTPAEADGVAVVTFQKDESQVRKRIPSFAPFIDD